MIPFIAGSKEQAIRIALPNALKHPSTLWCGSFPYANTRWRFSRAPFTNPAEKIRQIDRLEIADLPKSQFHPVFEKRAIAEVCRANGQRLIHRKHEIASPVDPFFIAKSLHKSLA